MEELELVGPWEMISLWSKFAQGPEKCLMVAENPGPVICNKGMSVNPHVTFGDCPPLDFLLVPGGEGTRREVDNSSLIQFVAGQATGCKAGFLSVLAHSSFTGLVCSQISELLPIGLHCRSCEI